MARILIVDDQDSIRTLLRKILERRGYEVTEAEDGQTALDVLPGSAFDLVITDIYMPGMDGLEFLRGLRAVRPRPSVIAMSGGGVMGSEQMLDLAKALGAGSVITKPFLPHELLARVEELIGSADPGGAAE